MITKNLEPKIKLEITEEIQAKITRLCRTISNVEWSGILLYTVKSPEMSIKDPENLVFVVKDIIPMDKGDAASTGFNMVETKRDSTLIEDPHMDYCEKYPEAIRWTIGLIHSHHNMDVFFSGVDKKELEDNAPEHRYYLSLIVNNKNEMIAKVAIASKVEDRSLIPFYGMDNEGEPYLITELNMLVSSNYLFTYDCEIVKPENVSVEDDFFEERLNAILNKSSIVPRTNSFDFNIGQRYASKSPQQQKPFSFSYSDKDLFGEDFFKEEDKVITDKATENFVEEFILEAMFAQHGSRDFISIASFFADLDTKKLPYNFVASVVNNYVSKFKTYFKEDKNDTEFFIDFKKCVIEVLLKYSKKYPFLIPIVKEITSVKLYNTRKNGNN